VLREILEKYNLLNESPTAVLGDADFSNLPNFHFGEPLKYAYEKDWEIIYSIRIKERNYYFSINKKHNQTLEILTDLDDNNERYDIIGRIELIRVKNIENLKKEYKPLYQVNKIYIDNKHRKRGLGKLSYLIMLEILKYNLMSDSIQFDGPRVIYSKLSKFKEIYCDIVDIEKQEIIKENVEIFQNPKKLWDFDTEIWDFDLDKSKIRIVLYIKE